MRLVFLTKYITFLSILLFIGQNSYAQEVDSTKYKIESKFRTEYSPYFKFSTFYRGEDNYLLRKKLDSLTNKQKNEWTRYDSLSFAKTNLATGNLELAEHYFSHLNIDPDKNFNDNLHDLCAVYVAKDFEKGISKLKRNYPRTIQYSKIYFLKHIFEAQIKLQDDSHWFKDKPSVFNLNIDTLLLKESKRSERFQNEILIPLNKATAVLRLLVIYVHEDDPVIARSFNDLGVVLEKHISLSQAYIAYSIGRNYNKKDKEILENIKSVKAKLITKNYKIPNFRKYFPKTKAWRFDYDILKEKILEENIDTITKHVPALRPEKRKEKLPFSPDLLIPGGILAFFLLILLFVRTRKR